jgi:cell division protein FtsQ
VSSPTTTDRPGADRAAIDPRLRARRIGVRREEGRRRLRRLAVLASVVLAVAVAFWITRSPLLDIDRVDVTGAEHTEPTAIREAAGLGRGQSLLYADLRTARRAVERLPWVAAARVTRHWPGTVRIVVEERVAVAAVPADGGGWVVADGAGRLLEHAEVAPTSVPRLGGVEPVAPEAGGVAGEDARTLLGVLARLPEALRGAVASAALSASGDGEIEFGVAVPGGGAAAVRFGPPELVEEKLLALAAVLSGADPAGVVSIDVRVPSVPVLTRR